MALRRSLRCTPFVWYSSRTVTVRAAQAKLKETSYEGANEILLVGRDEKVAERRKLRQEIPARSPALIKLTAKIRKLIKSGKHGAALRLFSQTPDRDGPLFNAALNACSKSLRYRDAQQLWSEMPGESKDVVSYSTMIDLFRKLKLASQAEDLFVEMKQVEVQPNVITYSSLISVYGMTEQPEKALEVLNVAKATVWQQADEVSKQMTFLAVMTAFARIGDYAQTREIFIMMIGEGIPPSQLHFNALLTSCAQARHAEIARAIFNTMPQWGLKPRAEDYTILITCCKDDLPFCKTLFDEMVRSDITPNSVTYREMLEAYVIARDGQGGRALVDQAGSKLDRNSREVERFLNELQSLSECPGPQKEYKSVAMF